MTEPMSTIDRVKELLAAASPGPWKVNWGTDLALPDVLSLHLLDVDNSDYLTNFSTAQLVALVRPIAEELVASQKALKRCESMISEEGWPDCTAATEARATLLLDGLAKAMKGE